MRIYYELRIDVHIDETLIKIKKGKLLETLTNSVNLSDHLNREQ